MFVSKAVVLQTSLAALFLQHSLTDAHILDCNFDDGLCLWNIENSSQWLFLSGATPSAGTGPSRDHTGGGKYIYHEAIIPKDKAQLLSPQFSTNYKSSGCLSFWYHMFGKDINLLNVYIITGNTSRPLWSLHGNQGNYWRMATVSIEAEKLSKVVLEAVTGDGEEGDIAIDDIIFDLSHNCSNTPSFPQTSVLAPTLPRTSKSTPKDNTAFGGTTKSTSSRKNVTELSPSASASRNVTQASSSVPAPSHSVSTRTSLETTPNMVMIRTTKDMKSYCPKETLDQIKWWKTAAGSVDTKPCGPGYIGSATRRCSTDAVWLPPVYIDCVDNVLHNTTEKVKELANITDPVKASAVINDILNSVQNTTDKVDNKPLKSGDLVRTTEILQDILAVSNSKNAKIDSQVVGNVLNSVLKTENHQSWNEVNTENNQSKSAANIMSIVDDLGHVIQKDLLPNETKTIQRDNIEIEVSSFQKDLAFPGQKSDSHIQLPRQPGLNGKFYTAVLYKTISNLLPNTKNRSIGSDVLSISFDRKAISLSDNVTITFARNKQIDFDDPSIDCGYWNFSTRTWSYDGCYLRQSDGHQAVCVCNHLTNFAILMSPADVQLSEGHLKALEIITYVGCGLSVLGCLLTLIIYSVFWRYVKNEWAVILVNLCIALIIGYSVFMGASEETGNEIWCNFITGVLHYVFLVVFFLMLCEGISVVVSVTVVFKTKSKLPIYLSLAWIVPIVIVGATMGITRLENYHADRYCWLETSNYVFMAFVGPAVLVILINIIAIILVLRALYSSAMMTNERLRKKARAGLRCMATLLPVLGLSWLFGVLAFNEDTVIFQYLFGITTSFQGLFIFVFHVIFNKKVHAGFKQKMHRKQLKAQSNISSRPKSSGSNAGTKANSTDTTNLKDVKTKTPTKKELKVILGFNRSKAYQVTSKT